MRDNFAQKLLQKKLPFTVELPIFFLLAGCLEDAPLAAGASPSGTRIRVAPSIGSVQNCVPAQHVQFGLLQHGP